MKRAAITSASSSSRRLVINGTSIFGGEALSRLATVVMALVVARSFGSESLGNYGYALALTSVLLIIPDFGLHLFTVREGSASPRRISEIFWSVHGVKFGLCAAVLAFAAVFGEWGISNSERRLLFYILMARVLLQTFSQAAMAVFKALERMQYVAFQQGINSLVVVLWVGVSLAVGARLPFAVAGLVAGQLVETCLGWIILRRVLPVGVIPRLMMWERSQLVRTLAGCCPIGLTAILLALNLRLDIFVLSRYVSSNVLGHFNAALWFVIATFLAASLLMSVLFPRLSRLLGSAAGAVYEGVNELAGRKDSPPGTGGVDAPIAEGAGADGVVDPVQEQKLFCNLTYHPGASARWLSRLPSCARRGVFRSLYRFVHTFYDRAAVPLETEKRAGIDRACSRIPFLSRGGERGAATFDSLANLDRSADEAGEYVLSLLKNALFITALGALLVWLSAPAMIRLFFGEDFEPAANTLRILAPAMPLGFLNTIFFYVFAAARRRFVCLVTLGFGVAAGTLLSFYLTSRFGAAGCATAAVLREFMISSSYLFFFMQANHSRLRLLTDDRL